MSWYEIGLRLRMPDIISQNSKDLTIVENLVRALVRESSVRTRRPVEVAVKGLAPLPTPVNNFPQLMQSTKLSKFDGGMAEKTSSFSPDKQHLQRPKSGVDNGAGVRKSSGISGSSVSDGPPIIKRQLDLDSIKGGGGSSALPSNGKLKPSSENWVPEIIRMRSLHRDFSVAKENLGDIIKRETSERREMKQFQKSPYDIAVQEESLGTTHKVPCACCFQMFLYVNLPVRVTQKAVLDIRAKWSGGLNSATVFTGVVSQNKREDRLKAIPRCYDDARVCYFCAQFFLVQEDYRPTFQQITYEERKTLHFDQLRREKEYWDPLLMASKDKDLAEMNKTTTGTSTEDASVDG
jgi:hypothetical protein